MKKPGGSERRSRARRRALQALYQWQVTGQPVEEIIEQFRRTQDLSQVDEAYFERLVRGVGEQREGIDANLAVFVDRPLAQLDVTERAIIRLSAWELLNCPEVPVRVVLDEGIELAHRFGAERAHAFVNGVLDKAARAWRALELS